MDDLAAWKRLAPAGLLLVGAGLSTAVDAAQRRTTGAATSRWTGQGTVGLVLVNAGLCLFGESVRRRTRYELAPRGAR
ncbi:hypothetical protein [Kineococcus rhizosphaerae]|uniref:Uncharacterized protein n=1 Tax=Kineococcus rhizosphaerae TaxID=559628 RepID=A0A2T0R3K0_9ACTN|nr:hypothetical protein [Kineococcus rhizosphaerae]PRY14573.1 hypothetical protein CLV37_106131 [Kineococcus rhizosphaerae]